jgi:hypothetical protein
MLKKLIFIMAVITAVLIAGSISVFADNDTNISTTESPISEYTEPESAVEQTNSDTEEDPIKILIDSLVYDTELEETDQVLVTVLKPDSPEKIVYKSSYIFFCGTDESDIVLVMAKKNLESGEYDYLENVDGESVYEMGGICSSELELEKGENIIKLIAFRKSEIDNLEHGVNLQVNYFKITFLEESIKERLINSIYNKLLELFQPTQTDSSGDNLFGF